MTKFKRNFGSGCVMVLLISLMVAGGPAIGGEPKPGDVINAANVEQYQDYFPYFMQRFITDGWGFSEPLTVHVTEYAENINPKSFREITRKNAGKTKLNPDGSLSGYEAGIPFPDPQEPNKALKIMWNFQHRWRGDDYWYPGGYIITDKRKDSKAVSKRANIKQLKFAYRTVLDPKPELNNPKDLFFAWLYLAMTPPNKDMTTLTWRYNDSLKYDDMWCWIPTLRRTLRLVSSDRSTPVNGTPYTWDDFYGWDGQTLAFDYKMLGEKPMLGICNSQTDASKHPNGYDKPVMGGPDNPYEIRDIAIVEVKSKNPRHPESKKILYMQQRNKRRAPC